MGIWGGKDREKGTEEMFEVIMDANFSKLMTENKPRNFLDTKQDKYLKMTASKYIIFKLQNQRKS